VSKDQISNYFINKPVGIFFYGAKKKKFFNAKTALIGQEIFVHIIGRNKK
jgi:hypothetical protein